MQIKATHKIGDNYVIADNRKVYRLPFKSGLKYYLLRELKPYKNGYYINGIYTKREHIKYEAFRAHVLFEIKETPFD